MKHAVYDENNNIVRPAFQIAIRNDGHLVSLVRNDVNVVFDRTADDHLVIKHGIDHTIDDFNDLVHEFGMIDNTEEAYTKAELYETMTQKALNNESVKIGNVLLYSSNKKLFRPPIPGNKIISSTGWQLNEWPLETGYRSMYPVIINYDSKYYVCTPIRNNFFDELPDHSYDEVFSSSAMDNYISNILDTSTDEACMTSDAQSERYSLIFYITDSLTKANLFVQLLNEWEDYFMCETIAKDGEGKILYDNFIRQAMDNQDDTIEDICEPLGITDTNVVKVVNKMFPFFNCQPDDTDVAWGRLIRLLYHELWIIVPREG